MVLHNSMQFPGKTFCFARFLPAGSGTPHILRKYFFLCRRTRASLSHFFFFFLKHARNMSNHSHTVAPKCNSIWFIYPTLFFSNLVCSRTLIFAKELKYVISMCQEWKAWKFSKLKDSVFSAAWLEKLDFYFWHKSCWVLHL